MQHPAPRNASFPYPGLYTHPCTPARPPSALLGPAGVTEADLEGVTLRAKDAQKAIRALLQGEGGRPVVLVGHSLHHDLAALRLDHQPVIDTAMLYGFEWVLEGRGDWGGEWVLEGTGDWVADSHGLSSCGGLLA